MTAMNPDLDALLHHVKTSYSGYADKVRGRSAELEQLTEVIRQRIQSAPDDREEFSNLLEWLAFFNDRHMFLVSTRDSSSRDELTPDDGRSDLRLEEVSPETLLL